MSSSKAPRSFLIISIPETRQQSAVPMLEHETRSLCRTSLFQVPMLKVGGLGENVRLADDIEKADQQVEKAVKRIGKWLYDLIKEDQPDVSIERALTVNSATMYDYVRNFEWNHARYPPKISTGELLQTITTETSEHLTKLQARTTEFTNVCQAISSENKKQTGTLFVRDLSELVDPTHMVFTDSLKTILVVVPRHGEKEWIESYYTLCPAEDNLPAAVVPDSLLKLDVADKEDKENALYAILIMRRREDQLRTLLRDMRLGVRDVPVRDADTVTGREKMHRLTTQREERKADLIRWCKTFFGESFIAWLHLKAIRIFVESALRYSVPPNFKAVLCLPNSSSDEKKMLKKLVALYDHLGPSSSKYASEKVIYPFVMSELNLSLTQD
mmetsp:Transcript_23990/g.60012  ORF Transcript_23990/g.60012 Transcript_23990/m.60012 type:complete len:386 (+) Transcript_23990:35-1192(+)|eukprot:CAMPEP_0177654612 /NCGR_PEP_ID=MMETSP0447-20121125/14439_1 /TAXON_ID=0 /ORGANISM="Stygamoeba regulata, Strain BSH-02190019" /LENGTH=385 /DNA_ID=CAMNT_0019158301 /DNA_START=20 /DNA_END=1177 /DNA_ORIENTATION=+